METKNKTCLDCFYCGLVRGYKEKVSIHKCKFFKFNVRSTTPACGDDYFLNKREAYYEATFK